LIADDAALVPIKDPLALAEKICWFLRRRADLHALGGKQRSAAREKFSLERMVAATEGLYQEMLHK
jgi:glycosyltransferase involved in cell wall biosynthesis